MHIQKRLAAFYPPPTHPHTQTGYPWICRQFLIGDDEVPHCSSNKCPGIYLFFLSEPYEFPENSGKKSYLLDYIGKSDVNMYSRFDKHKKGKYPRDPGAILCAMKLPCTNGDHNYQAYDIEASLLHEFVTILNDPGEGGFDATTTEIVYDSHGLPFDIMASFYGLDINNPKKPFPFVEGRYWIDLKKHNSKMVEEINDGGNDLLFPDGIPYQGDMELEGKEFEKACNRTDNKEEKVKFRLRDGIKGADAKGDRVSWKTRIGVGAAAAAAGVGGAFAAVAGAAGNGAVSVATAAGHGIAHVVKDGADIIVSNQKNFEDIDKDLKAYRETKEKNDFSVEKGEATSPFPYHFFRITNKKNERVVFIIESSSIPRFINHFHINALGQHLDDKQTYAAVQNTHYHITNREVRTAINLCAKCRDDKQKEKEKKEKEIEMKRSAQIKTTTQPMPIKTTAQPIPSKTTTQTMVATTNQLTVAKDDQISFTLVYKGFGASITVGNGSAQKSGFDNSNIINTRKRKLDEIVEAFRKFTQDGLYGDDENSEN
ncbi:hypothetical protein RB653_009752 [Dictyostelium firmibasis]|uniref:Uncharacterized protein n=1 Tax=Dictyostelium firmibasis TaxID=79012 RepID=A0AAN7TKJ0_9MYCE